MKYTTARERERERERERDRERKRKRGGSGWIHVASYCPRHKDKGLQWEVKYSLKTTAVKEIERRPQVREDGEKSIVNGR